MGRFGISDSLNATLSENNGAIGGESGHSLDFITMELCAPLIPSVVFVG